MKKIALIGNCQSTALSNFFKRVNGIEVVSLLDINCQGTPDFERDKYRLLNSNDIDFVLSQPLSDSFNNLSSSFLREKFKDRFISYTNIFFTGLHPDLSYFGSFNQRINSPLGDYHSKLALTAFAKNMSITECLDLYCQEV
ncbi:WcbI family polysaccharide biosynthesis putative acetyltransferase [Acinetobacter brisouii]|uniref:WcbI family polysaccharide biosynthesis putative acetyltransferase n=1 Tax=Acinetobacter brisouii TaxID=396323 RepID=UPI00124BD61C|nr:WcbI family polysaccharide biosynthesis putative acetyltransferase [Acinetobacter brisouii]